MRNCVRIIVGVIALFCSLARGDGLLIVSDGPARTDHFAFAPLEVAFHHVQVEINDQVATTHVDQAFFNPTGRRLEGTYIFPLPEGATIDKFSMDIDGQQTEAELLDATRARATYEEIVRKYRDPALLEYAGRGAMKVRVFPIEPNSTKRIQISYTHVLKSDSGIMEYTYPLNTEKFSAKPLKDVSVSVKLACSAAIKSIYSPTHDIEVRRNGARRATVGYEAKNVRPDIDYKLIISREADPIGLHLLSYRTSPREGYFMLMASPGQDESDANVQAKDICFVLDTSGSMAGAKIEQAKRALKFCLVNLNPKDRFEVIRFSSDAQNLFGELSPATKEHVAQATQFVEELRALGGTAIDDALQKALKLRNDGERPFQIIFLTDGQPTVGLTNEDKIVAHVAPDHGDARGNVRIFPFGVGTDVNTTLLDRIATDTHAFSQYVLPKEDIEIKVSDFYSKIQSPVLTGVKLTCDNSDVRLSDIYPGTLPDLFKGETLVVFGKYTLSGKDIDARITLSGNLNGTRQEIISPARFGQNNSRFDFIPRLWATRRVGWLLDEIRLHGESAELKDEITSLARQHGIVTPYTAYLIMEDERKRNVPVSIRSMQELEKDATASTVVTDVYDSNRLDSGKLQRAGAQAVANSSNMNSFKQAENVQQMQQKGGLAKSAAFADDVGYKSAQNYTQQVRVVNGRAFYQNGKTWTDNTAQSKKDLKRKNITFNSNQYYELLSQYPGAIPWFSLGEEVDVVIDDTLYVVR